MMTLYFLIFLLTNNWLQIIFLRLHFLDCPGYRREDMYVLLDQTLNERGLIGLRELHLPNWSSIFINSRSFLEHLPDFTTAFIMLLIASWTWVMRTLTRLMWHTLVKLSILAFYLFPKIIKRSNVCFKKLNIAECKCMKASHLISLSLVCSPQYYPVPSVLKQHLLLPHQLVFARLAILLAKVGQIFLRFLNFSYIFPR